MGLDHTTFCLKNQVNDPIEIQLLSHHGAREGQLKDGFMTQPAHWNCWAAYRDGVDTFFAAAGPCWALARLNSLFFRKPPTQLMRRFLPKQTRRVS